jgi:hypothetical protein
VSILHPRRLGVCAAFAVCLSPLLFAAEPAKAPPRTETFDGKVVPLAGVLEKLGARLDPDAAANSLALVTDDGKVYPLVKDDGARMFWKDKRLLERRMRLAARVLPDVGMLQVVQVNSWVNGRLCDVYYWCDVCSIRRNEAGKCDCCGAALVLHEEPLKK